MVNDLLMWIGADNYSRESFVEEANKMGVCKRICGYPNNIILGISRVFFISDTVKEIREKRPDEVKRRDHLRYVMSKELRPKKTGIYPKVTGDWEKGVPTIFGYCVIGGVVYVPVVDRPVPIRYKDRILDIYDYVVGAYGFNNERHAGSLEQGALYIISERSIKDMEKLNKNMNPLSSFYSMVKRPQYNKPHFRGFRYISHEVGDKLIVQGVLNG